jgi:hypothetical protein
MSVAKALKIDLAIRRNVYAYQLFRTYVGRLDFMLPLELEFCAFRVLPSSGRLFLDIGANDGISARSFRLFNKTAPILSIEANPCHEGALKRTKAALDLFDYKLIAAGRRSSDWVPMISTASATASGRICVAADRHSCSTTGRRLRSRRTERARWCRIIPPRCARQ